MSGSKTDLGAKMCPRSTKVCGGGVDVWEGGGGDGGRVGDRKEGDVERLGLERRRTVEDEACRGCEANGTMVTMTG